MQGGHLKGPSNSINKNLPRHRQRLNSGYLEFSTRLKKLILKVCDRSSKRSFVIDRKDDGC